MKRPHRRIHLLAWLLLAPATAIAGFYFWSQRPETPYTGDLPAGIETVDDAAQGAETGGER